jgi:F-type H+-transporting ATPase subunit b
MSLNQIFTLDPGSVLWTIISFVVLLVILTKVAWKPILGALEAREQGIQDDIENAKTDRDDAAKAKVAHESALSEARQEAQGILGESRDRARQYEDQQKQETADALALMKVNADKEIELQRQQAMQGLQADMVDISLAAAEAVMRRSTSDDQEVIIRDFLKTQGGVS